MENAIRVLLALGGSAHAVVHLAVIAGRLQRLAATRRRLQALVRTSPSYNRPISMPPTSMPTRDQPASPTPSRRLRRTSAEQAQPYDFQHDSLGYALRRAQVRAYDLYFEMLGDMDLTPARVTALSLIAMEPEINQADLARRLEIAGPSALKVVDALEGAGLVSREEVAGDRRRYSLMLTGQGRERLEALRVALAGYEQRLAEALSAAERRQLMDLLSRVAI